jgi:chaperonin GroEL
VEDALNATRAAVEEGIVAGGGTALLRAAQKIDKSKYAEEEQWGAMIIRRACEEPIRQIAFNAGLDGAIVLDRVLSNKSATYGYNAYSDEYTDLLKDGVIDPMKVVRCALQNAASVSSLMLTTETMIAEAPKKDDKAAGGAPGMGGMGGMDMM